MLARDYYTYDVPEADRRNAIVITGCDSGIGRATAVHLVECGFSVIASTFTAEGREGVRREAEGMSGELFTHDLDITKPESVKRFRAFVESLVEERALRIVGLVNNAGAAWSGPLELQSVEEFDKQIQVNLIGHVRMCHEFIPLVRSGGGRIVNVASVAGLVGMSSMSAYCASKFGIEVVSDVLRSELRKFHISVSIIEPGWVKTPLVENCVRQLDSTWAKFGDQAKELYELEYRIERNYMPNALRQGVQPAAVTYAINHALTSPYPKTRYRVGVTAWLPYYLKMVLPTRVFDSILYGAMKVISKREPK